jgi:metallo-beta-lactamase family protein
MSVTVTFLGASGTVTGSKYLVEFSGPTPARILVDAGVFQGSREWRERNWHDPERELLRSIDAVVLTHAHIDHTGILPRYVRLGLRCPVYCTPPTKALTEILLLDSGMLQEEEARFRAKEGLSRHSPPLPLYTREDAADAIKLLRAVPFGKSTEVARGVKATWSHMGHILGAASINLESGGKVITFSGDIGRYHVPILKDPSPVALGDLLLVESTYGDRDHPEEGSAEHLGRIVKESAKRGGVLLIPSFAVGRTQTLLYYLRELKEKHAIPDIPIVVDSPMARDATELYAEFPSDYDEAALKLTHAGVKPFAPKKLFFIQDR